VHLDALTHGYGYGYCWGDTCTWTHSGDPSAALTPGKRSLLGFTILLRKENYSFVRLPNPHPPPRACWDIYGSVTDTRDIQASLLFLASELSTHKGVDVSFAQIYHIPRRTKRRRTKRTRTPRKTKRTRTRSGRGHLVEFVQCTASMVPRALLNWQGGMSCVGSENWSRDRVTRIGRDRC